jgi:hypothetical protein
MCGVVLLEVLVVWLAGDAGSGEQPGEASLQVFSKHESRDKAEHADREL